MKSKITILGKVNSEFDIFKLKSALLKNDAGDWGDLPSENNTIGVLRSTNFTNQGILNLSDVAYRSLKPHKLAEKKLRPGEIIIERSGGSDTQPVGRVGFISKKIANNNYAFANFIQRIALDDTIEPRYVYYCLQQMYEMGITASMQNQTTGIRNLDWKLYTKSILPKPKPHEQKAIAVILLKVDDAIKSIQNSIEVAQKLKKGLIQNLLTGKLKPDGSWRKEDEFYRDEKFGNIPVGWKGKKWGELLKLEYGKSLIKGLGNVPIYGTNGQIGLTTEPLVQSDGIIVGRKGEYREIHYSTSPFWVIDTAFYVVPKVDFNIKWAYYALKRHNINALDSGSAIPSTNKKDVYHLKTIMPDDKNEQLLIATKIDNVDSVICSKKQKKEKLQRLKKSLMQNLLTGKTRVDIAKLESALQLVKD